MCTGTLQQLLKASRFESSVILNALSFPLPLSGLLSSAIRYVFLSARLDGVWLRYMVQDLGSILTVMNWVSTLTFSVGVGDESL